MQVCGYRAGFRSGGFTTLPRVQGEQRILAASSSSKRPLTIHFADTVTQNRHPGS